MLIGKGNITWSYRYSCFNVVMTLLAMAGSNPVTSYCSN